MNHAIYGAAHTGKAGVYGDAVSTNSYGVIGEGSGIGSVGVFGTAGGATGVAGWFENTNANNTSYALDVRHWGVNSAANIFASNANSEAAALKVNAATKGDGIFISHTNLGGSANAGVNIEHLGSGAGLVAKSFSGHAAKFYVTNTASTAPTIYLKNDGTGKWPVCREYTGNINSCFSRGKQCWNR